MSKLLKLKNKPFWLVTALLIVFAAAYYQQTRKEGFEDANLKIVGSKVSVNMTKIPSDIIASFFTASTSTVNRAALKKVIDASDGKVLWNLGDTIPTWADEIKSYIFITNTDPVMKTATQLAADEKEILDRQSKNLNLNPGLKESSFKILNLVVETSDGKYVDKNGASLIGSTNVAGYNINTTVLWITVGIIVLVILFVLYKAFFGGSKAPNTVSNANRTANTSLVQQE